MKDLRIVIVSWNVENLLECCLRSLPEACRGLSWDVVVVDNASQDDSVSAARRMGIKTAQESEHGPRTVVKVIANSENRGFARACNQGITGADARYVLILNPDTECPPLSLFRFINIANACPDAGILGPQLIYPDGSYQESVRRFPTIWSQVVILKKIHHIAPWHPAYTRYLAKDLILEREQSVDQVMGACFLIRRELIEQAGGLDERYFVWFEEVDYCKRAHELGWMVRYVPSVKVVHHSGQAFAQVYSLKKQRMFNDSLLKYFKKWHPGWRFWLLKITAPYSIFLTWMMSGREKVESQNPNVIARSGVTQQSFRKDHHVAPKAFGAPRDDNKIIKKDWIIWIFAIFLLEAVSLSFVFWPYERGAITMLVGIGMLFLAWRRPDLGLAIILLELLIGAKGSLLKIPNGWDFDNGTSLRMVLLFTFIIGWLFNAITYWRANFSVISTERRNFVRNLVRGRGAWIALAILCVWAFMRGVWLGNGALLRDANAWGFLLILIPVLDVALRKSDSLIRHAVNVIIASLIWLPVKTLGLLYVFSHGIKSLSHPLYLWVRRTGVGEVTLVTGNLFRIFIQSQVYALAGFLFGSSYALSETQNLKPESRDVNIFWIILVASSVSILISLSRSFWVGLFFGLLVLLILKIIYLRSLVSWNSVWTIFSAVVIGAGLIFAVVAFPYPYVDVGSLKTLFGSRGSVTDVAAESRWNLLPVLVEKIKDAPVLGSGFGATVTYQTMDPRIRAQNSDGWYTTHAFEWGWLEHWIKFGILGIPVVAWLLLSLMMRLWKLKTDWWIRAGFISSLTALAALHIFTPYLNHPLGFAFLLTAEGYITAKSNIKEY
ncbi:MAG: glycosyltransferase family 2 protein [Patescibacteria group bacterium]|nr:glycosyltransferase family 2 protein [Patescibacteria group bacterium]MBU2508850.1 glycosyltransferase family 2 protein [Patescibacteria group bacterium]